MRKKKTALRTPEGHPTTSTSQTLGLIANDLEPGQSAGAEPVLDNLSHRTSRGFCCMANLHTVREARTHTEDARRAWSVQARSPLSTSKRPTPEVWGRHATKVGGSYNRIRGNESPTRKATSCCVFPE